MKVKDLIAQLNRVEDKEKDVSIQLSSHYGNNYDLSTDDIVLKETKHDVYLTE